jgi:nitrogen-specific signal transduction histidine kinase
MERPDDALAIPPYADLRQGLLHLSGELRREGQTAAASRIEEQVGRWWDEQRAWDCRVIETLRVLHDINNALVGVGGNAQLLMRAPAAHEPKVRERLDVIVRESNRIQAATGRLREIKLALEGASRESRAA